MLQSYLGGGSKQSLRAGLGGQKEEQGRRRKKGRVEGEVRGRRDREKEKKGD